MDGIINSQTIDAEQDAREAQERQSYSYVYTNIVLRILAHSRQASAMGGGQHQGGSILTSIEIDDCLFGPST